MVGSPRQRKDSKPSIHKKRTQTNPLRLNYFDSEFYLIFWKNEPIDVKWHYFNMLDRKKGRFSRNMDGAMSNARLYSRFEVERTH